MRRLHVCLCFEGYRKKYTSFEPAFSFDYDNYNFLFSGFSKMSNLRQLLKLVNLFSFKRRNQKNGILTLFLLWILVVFLFNVSIHSQSSETKTIFRSKNLLTDSKNLSETYSTTDNQNLRQRFVRSACQKFESIQSKVTLLTDPEKSLGYCHVPKIATSSWWWW
jgi:hypothetical protein